MILRRLRTDQQAVTRLEVALAILVLVNLAAIVCPKIFARRPYAGPMEARMQIGPPGEADPIVNWAH